MAIAAASSTSVSTWVAKRLGRHDRDLGPGLQEQHRVCLARDGRADGVGDRDDRAALRARVAGRRDRVGRLARLRHGDDERLLVERRRASNGTRSRCSSGPGCAASPGRRTRRRRWRSWPCRRRRTRRARPSRRRSASGSSSSSSMVVVVHSAGDRGADGLRLLVHLLEHEMLVAALLGGLDRPVDLGHEALARRAVDAGDDHSSGGDVGDVAFLEEDHAAGVGKHARPRPRPGSFRPRRCRRSAARSCARRPGAPAPPACITATA